VIQHLDKAVESFLRQQVPLPEANVDISFRAPEGSWTASVARPTVDVFLWDVARATRTSGTGRDERLAEDGRRQQRQPPTQVTLRYFVTVWAREQRDEHELLGAILHSVLRHDELPRTLLPPSLEDTVCRLVLAGNDHRLPPTLWGGAPVKPGLYVEVELGIDTTGWQDRGAPIEEMRLDVAAQDTELPEPAPEPEDRPPLRRFRSGGSIVMEGRPEPRNESDSPEGNGPR
jgi:hypothetical protein